MSADQPTRNSQPTQSYPPPSGSSQTGLWIAVIGFVLCLLAASALVVAFGVGRWVIALTEEENATATVQASIVLPRPGWSKVMDVQFGSNENDWDVGSLENSYGHAELSIVSGHYEWRLEANSEKGMLWWAFPTFHCPNDFYASTDCHLNGGNASATACGLVFRLIDGGNFYKFAVSEGQIMNIMLEKNGEIVNLFPWGSTDLVQPGETNRIAVLAKEAHYQFFINGQLAYELDDDQLTSGSVGLVADNWSGEEAEFQFDNFQLYEP